jgi:excisionase family DNA binding protein
MLWLDAVRSGSEDRPARLRLLAIQAQELVASALSLYAAYDDLFEETFALLGTSGLVGRDSLRIALEEADEGEGAHHLVTVIAELTREGSEAGFLEGADRERSFEIAAAWDEVLGREPVPVDTDTAGYLTVKEVADHFMVTPQAVYRWIDKDKIEWEQRPGGSYLLPAAQFDGLDAGLLAAATARRRRTPSAELESALAAGAPESVEESELVDPNDPAATFARPGSRRRVRAGGRRRAS